MSGRPKVVVAGPDGAPSLVLLHSIGTSVELWTPCAGPLAEQFRVVRVNAPGHGGAAPAPAGDVATLGQDVLSVLDDLGIERAHLAGLSLGGMTAMWLAIHHPERVARLALLCTSAYLPPPQRWLDRAATVRSDGMAAIVGAVGSWLTEAAARRDPYLVARLRDLLTSADAESYAQCCEAIAKLDLRADLPRICAPTLVIAGADDHAIPPPHGQAIAETVEGARLEIVGPAAHQATFEQPGRIAALLLGHFRGGATLASGFATRREVLGDVHVDNAIERASELTAPFQDFITRYAWGEVWSRPGLARRDRSIATLAVLVALGAEHEIAMHVRAARRNGLSAAEIGEVLLHTALYAGLPRANRALAIAQDVLAEDVAPSDPQPKE